MSILSTCSGIFFRSDCTPLLKTTSECSLMHVTQLTHIPIIYKTLLLDTFFPGKNYRQLPWSKAFSEMLQTIRQWPSPSLHYWLQATQTAMCSVEISNHLLTLSLLYQSLANGGRGTFVLLQMFPHYVQCGNTLCTQCGVCKLQVWNYEKRTWKQITEKHFSHFPHL